MYFRINLRNLFVISSTNDVNIGTDSVQMLKKQLSVKKKSIILLVWLDLLPQNCGRIIFSTNIKSGFHI